MADASTRLCVSLGRSSDEHKVVHENDVLMSGVLSKKSTLSRHMWQKRYFVLREMGLVYYKNVAGYEASALKGFAT